MAKRKELAETRTGPVLPSKASTRARPEPVRWAMAMPSISGGVRSWELLKGSGDLGGGHGPMPLAGALPRTIGVGVTA